MSFAFGRLGRYFAGRFLTALFVVLFAVSLLIYAIDLFELLRRAGQNPKITLNTLLYLAALRLPFVLDQVLPFAVLFAAIASFLGLSRRLELVIARAAGLSAWQFISPALLIGLLAGVLATTALNPVVVSLKNQAEAVDEQTFGRRGGDSSTGFWLRQRNTEGDAVISAARLADQQLGTVTVFFFKHDGTFTGRWEAKTGLLEPGQWRFTDVRVVSPGQKTEQREQAILSTTVTARDLAALAARNPNASFWALPGLIERLELAGLSATRYQLVLQGLYAKPLLFVAMVLIAASVSLRFFRMGGVAQMVGIGVVGGFLLYVLNQITQDLGAAGFLPATVAAWSPAAIGALAAAQALLRLEDG